MKLHRVSVVMMMMALPALLGIRGAHAQVVCPNQHIFIYRPNALNDASGQATTTAIRSVTSDPACTNENRHATAHIRQLGVGFEPLVEFGWWRTLTTSYVFYEIKFPNGQVDIRFWPTSAPPNWVSRYKLERVFGGTTWTFWRDWSADGTYDDQYPCAGCAVDALIWGGAPMGEAARVGNTPAYDHHIDLRSRVGTTWSYWNDQAMERDEIPTDHWHQIGGREFEVHPPNAQHPN